MKLCDKELAKKLIAERMDDPSYQYPKSHPLYIEGYPYNYRQIAEELGLSSTTVDILMLEILRERRTDSGYLKEKVSEQKPGIRCTKIQSLEQKLGVRKCDIELVQHLIRQSEYWLMKQGEFNNYNYIRLSKETGLPMEKIKEIIEKAR